MSCAESVVGAAIARLRAAVEAAEAARRDPAVQAKAAEEYAGHVVSLDDLPDLKRRLREKDWATRGIPERLWPVLHDGAPGQSTVGPLAPQPWAALEAMRRFLEPAEAKLILLLAGTVGVGKTTAAAWAAAWYPGAIFVKAWDLVAAGLYPEDAGFWPRLFTAKLVAVDDLAVEPFDAKGHGLSAIETFVDKRYDGRRKTILTTNLPPDPFRERVGERIWRRIVEVGRVVGVKARGVP